MKKTSFFNKITLLTLVVAMLAVAFPAFPVLADGDEEFDALEVNYIMGNTTLDNLKAVSAILVDIKTGSILFKKNPDERLPIASVTKIMSMLLIMEAVDSGKVSLSDMVRTSEYAYGFGGSQVYLEPGEEFTLEEMLKAIAIHSANDATVAVAEKISGSEDAFVQLMNSKARELGMENTHFLDSTGLNDDGYSSARDVAIMSRELVLKHPKVLEYTKMWHSPFRDMELYNRNALVRHYEGTTGLKTGTTSRAGHNLSLTVERDGMHLVAVVLGEPDSNTRFAEAQKLANYGFANFEIIQAEKGGVVAGEVEVKKGLKKSVSGIIEKDLELLIRKGDRGKLKREIILEKAVTAPVAKGQKIGEALYRIEGYSEPLGKLAIVAGESVEKASFTRLFVRMIRDWFTVGRD